MDERIKNEYRKIYAELMMLIMVFCAVSLLVKFNVYNMEMRQCATEFIILVGTPVYMAVRQWMMGLNPNEMVSKRRKRTSFAAAVVCATAAFLSSSLFRSGRVDGHGAVNILIFIAVFTVVYYIGQRLTAYFAEKKTRKYEEK